MLQTNLAEMEGGGEIIVADRPDTLRATTLALAQRGQLDSYAKNSQTIAQDVDSMSSLPKERTL